VSAQKKALATSLPSVSASWLWLTPSCCCLNSRLSWRSRQLSYAARSSLLSSSPSLTRSHSSYVYLFCTSAAYHYSRQGAQLWLRCCRNDCASSATLLVAIYWPYFLLSHLMPSMRGTCSLSGSYLMIYSVVWAQYISVSDAQTSCCHSNSRRNALHSGGISLWKALYRADSLAVTNALSRQRCKIQLWQKGIKVLYTLYSVKIYEQQMTSTYSFWRVSTRKVGRLYCM